MIRFALALLLALAAGQLHAQDSIGSIWLPGQVSTWFVNEDGSCVQCSISNCGWVHNCPQAATLLENSVFGPRVRGGSGPGRVQAYAEARSIPCWNITGKATWEWMDWAVKNRRIAAIGCFGSHFQTLVTKEPDPLPWKVRNNWYGITDKHYSWTDAQFRQHHVASGNWAVILKLPPAPLRPVYEEWWK